MEVGISAGHPAMDAISRPRWPERRWDLFASCLAVTLAVTVVGTDWQNHSRMRINLPTGMAE